MRRGGSLPEEHNCTAVIRPSLNAGVADSTRRCQFSVRCMAIQPLCTCPTDSHATHLGPRDESSRLCLVGGEQSMKYSQQLLQRRLYVKTRPASPRGVAL